jgi:hypothetical protein
MRCSDLYPLKRRGKAPTARADAAQAVGWQLSKMRGLCGSIQAAALARMRQKGTTVSDMSCTPIKRLVHVMVMFKTSVTNARELL